MDIKEFKSAKLSLERELCELINTRVQQFTETTGMSIDGVSVRLVKHQVIGGYYAESIVSDVSVDVSL